MLPAVELHGNNRPMVLCDHEIQMGTTEIVEIACGKELAATPTDDVGEPHLWINAIAFQLALPQQNPLHCRFAGRQELECLHKNSVGRLDVCARTLLVLGR